MWRLCYRIILDLHIQCACVCVCCLFITISFPVEEDGFNYFKFNVTIHLHVDRKAMYLSKNMANFENCNYQCISEIERGCHRFMKMNNLSPSVKLWITKEHILYILYIHTYITYSADVLTSLHLMMTPWAYIITSDVVLGGAVNAITNPKQFQWLMVAISILLN